MKSIGTSIAAIALISASVLAFTVSASASDSVQTKRSAVCAGEKKCVEEKTLSAVQAQLAQQKELYKKLKADNDAGDHFECYGESADPFGDIMKHPDVTIMLGSADSETEEGSSETVYTNEVMISIALPQDCNEGNIIHNWAPRAVYQLTLTETVTSHRTGRDTSKFQLKLK